MNNDLKHFFPGFPDTLFLRGSITGQYLALLWLPCLFWCVYLDFTVSSSSHFSGHLNYKHRENTSAVCFKLKSCPVCGSESVLASLRLSFKNNSCFIDLPLCLSLTCLFKLAAAVRLSNTPSRHTVMEKAHTV